MTTVTEAQSSGTAASEAALVEDAALSPEQEKILRHPAKRHGRILAGPGTGKSKTVLALAQILVNGNAPSKARVITFTRAATGELVKKIQQEGHTDVGPVTVHSFALSLLMSNQDKIHLPVPLRIPDEWETKNLVHPDLARRIRTRGHKGDVRTVRSLEREMAADWESMEPGRVMLADLDPALRNAYVAAWQEHRRVFGYCLFAEMCPAAATLLDDHPDAKRPDVDLLIVDEFQDLNKADVAMLERLSELGVAMLGVGDDDQSIYSFRQADPNGIREFLKTFPDAEDYTLSTSFRCGRNILQVARDLIETAPGRPPRPSLDAGPNNAEGTVEYLRFAGEAAERKGVARVVRRLIDVGIPPNEIGILFRADNRSAWSKPLRKALGRAGVACTDVEAALAPLHSADARRLLAFARIIDDPSDSLAWWAYLHLTSGVSDTYVVRVADEALAEGVRFAERLLECPTRPPQGVSAASQSAAVKALSRILPLAEQAAQGLLTAPPTGWGEALIDLAPSVSVTVDGDLEASLMGVSAITDVSEGLGHYLNQLEPVTKDLATGSDDVLIMTMTRSKGLTLRAVIIMGVEDGVIPSGRPEADEDEERRILYVGITRATEFCFLTMARTRRGPTAMTGGQAMAASRSRCRFLNQIGLRPVDGDQYLRAFVAG